MIKQYFSRFRYIVNAKIYWLVNIDIAISRVSLLFSLLFETKLNNINSRCLLSVNNLMVVHLIPAGNNDFVAFNENFVML